MPRKPKTSTPRFIDSTSQTPSQRKRRGVSYNYKKRTIFGLWQGKWRKESSGVYDKNMMANTFGWSFRRKK